MRRRYLLAACLAALPLAGCAPSGPRTYPVSGTVTLDGQPLPEGHITFMPVSDDASAAAGKVTAGQFAFQAQAGNKRVEIMANRAKQGAAVDPAMGAAPLEQYIPAQYNTESTLTAEVKVDGANQFEFQLKTRP
jgi:hypothetical protein